MNPESRNLARRIAKLTLEKKAEDVILLDLTELSSACDFFVIATAQSETQAKAIADHVEETLKDDSIRPWHVEGRSHRRWILLDYIDVVAHVFHKDARNFYLLEKLWADAPIEEIVDGPNAVPSKRSLTHQVGEEES